MDTLHNVNEFGINLTKCLAPKCYKKGNNSQCNNKRKPNSVFCGKHTTSKYRLDKMILSPMYITNEDEDEMDWNANINLESQCLTNPNGLSISIMKKNKRCNKIKKDKNTMKHKNKRIHRAILEYRDLDSIDNIYFKDLKNTVNHLGLPYLGTKKVLYCKLKNYYKMMMYYKKHVSKVIIVQKTIRKRMKKIRNQYKGPGFYLRCVCNNQTDFYNLEQVVNIPDCYFFSYKDKDNFVYGFDIRSFIKLIENELVNPYNRHPIPDKAIWMMKKRMEQMRRQRISFEYEDHTVFTALQKLNMDVMNVFQKIDDLNTAAGGTDIHWFMDLPIDMLKIFYKELEDIWNYRAQLTLEAKQRIVPDGNVFKISVSKMFKTHNLNKIRYRVLKDMDTLVSCGITEADRNLGALWILTALTIVSPSCASALPWLIQ